MRNLLLSIIVPIGIIMASFSTGVLVAGAQEDDSCVIVGPHDPVNKALVYRLSELERKVSGMQKQITRLHALREAAEKHIDELEDRLDKTRDSLAQEIRKRRAELQ